MHGINDPRQVLDLEHVVSPETAIWCEKLIEAGRLDMYGSHQTDQPGTIYAVPAAGMVPSNPDVILPAVVRTMADPTIERRLAKPAATGDTEQHLVVTVRDGHVGVETDLLPGDAKQRRSRPST